MAPASCVLRPASLHPRLRGAEVKRLILFGGSLALVGIAIAMLPRSRPPAVTASAKPGPAAALDSENTDRRSRPATESPSATSASAQSVAGEPGESERTSDWERLVPAERIEIIQRDLEHALVAIERGEATPAIVASAEGGLTALRFELYDSERGRAIHAAYEQRLDRALEPIHGSPE